MRMSIKLLLDMAVFSTIEQYKNNSIGTKEFGDFLESASTAYLDLANGRIVLLEDEGYICDEADLSMFNPKPTKVITSRGDIDV